MCLNSVLNFIYKIYAIFVISRILWKRAILYNTFEASIFPHKTKFHGGSFRLHLYCFYSQVSRILCYGYGCSTNCLTILSLRGRWGSFRCGNHTNINTYWYKHLCIVLCINRLFFSGKIPRRANAGAYFISRGNASWAFAYSSLCSDQHVTRSWFILGGTHAAAVVFKELPTLMRKSF